MAILHYIKVKDVVKNQSKVNMRTTAVSSSTKRLRPSCNAGTQDSKNDQTTVACMNIIQRASFPRAAWNHASTTNGGSVLHVV